MRGVLAVITRRTGAAGGKLASKIAGRAANLLTSDKLAGLGDT